MRFAGLKGALPKFDTNFTRLATGMKHDSSSTLGPTGPPSGVNTTGVPRRLPTCRLLASHADGAPTDAAAVAPNLWPSQHAAGS